MSEKVTVGLPIWEEMNRNYRLALTQRDAAQNEEKKRREELTQARQEIDRQRARANRSQNEAQARASELREMRYKLKEFGDRNLNQFEQIQNLLVEKREAEKEAREAPQQLNVSIGKQLSQAQLRVEELQGEVEDFRAQLPIIDRIHTLLGPFKDALEELLLDE